MGYVARAHGVRGELRVQLFDAASRALHEVERVWIGGVERAALAARPTSGAVLLTVAGVRDKDAADALRGAAVEVPRAAIPLGPGEFLVSDLVGLEVVDETGTALGRAVAILPGAQDLLVIHDDAHERILPVVPEFILAVERAAGRVVVRLPEGLPVEPIDRRRRR